MCTVVVPDANGCETQLSLGVTRHPHPQKLLVMKGILWLTVSETPIYIRLALKLWAYDEVTYHGRRVWQRLLTSSQPESKKRKRRGQSIDISLRGMLQMP